jgi:hypothetical protein
MTGERISNDTVLRITVSKHVDRQLLTEIEASDLSYEGFGLLIVDIVRHGAQAYKVPEDAIWDWVEKERNHPTTPIIELKPN